MIIKMYFNDQNSTQYAERGAKCYYIYNDIVTYALMGKQHFITVSG